VLTRILEEARRITGARYAALGVLDPSRTELERFLTAGVDTAAGRAIGGPPPGHPDMHAFLGVPILIRGEAWGNLYLTEKEGGGEFTEADEEAAVILSEWAATAIVNARLHDASERRRQEAERAVRSLQAARDIASAIGTVADLDRVLELIVKRGRSLVEARSVLIMLREGDELVVAASAGHVDGAR